MRLRKLKLKNFRGYRNSTEIIIDESMTGIVGRNDFGKRQITTKTPFSSCKLQFLQEHQGIMLEQRVIHT